MARERLRPMLLLSQDMATMVDTAMDMVLVTDMVDMDMDTMDTMARDPLMLRLSPDMATMDMDMVMVMVLVTDMVDMDMDTMDTTARDPLMLRLSQDMATTDMDMAMVVMDMVMDMAMVRDPPMLSQDMATTVTDTAMGMDMDMDTAMDMVTDTTDKQYKCFLLAV